MAAIFAYLQNMIRGSEFALSVTLSVAAAYFVGRYFLRKGSEKGVDEKKKERAVAGPKPLEFREYTKAELLEYNGTTKEHILVGIRGAIYDVSAKHEFYGPGGPYSAFAGRDASRLLAKMSTDAAEADKGMDDLNAEDIKSLDEWEDFYKSRYTVVGKLVA